MGVNIFVTVVTGTGAFVIAVDDFVTDIEGFASDVDTSCDTSVALGTNSDIEVTSSKDAKDDTVLVVLIAFKVEAGTRTPMDENDDNSELCVIPKPVLTETSGEEIKLLELRDTGEVRVLDDTGMEEGREVNTNGRCTDVEIASPVNTVGVARFCDMVGVNGEETGTVGGLRSWSLTFSFT